MGIVIKQGGWSSVIAYIGIVVGYINVGYFFPKLLTTNEFGLRAILVELSLLGGYVANFGTGNSLNRFKSFYTASVTDTTKYVSTLFLINMMGILLVTGALFLFKHEITAAYIDRSPLFVDYFYLVVPFIALISFNYFFESLFSAHLNTVIATFSRDLLVRIVQFGFIMLYALGKLSIHQFWIGFVGAYFCTLCFLLLYALHKQYFFIRFSLLKFSELKKLLSFSGYAVLGTVTAMIVLKVDVIMIGALANNGLDAVAVYAMCMLMMNVIDVPKKALYQLVIPLISTHLENEDMAQIKKLYRKTAISLMVIGGFLFLLIYINCSDLYLLIPKGNFFEQGKTTLLILGIAKLVEMSFGSNDQIIGYSKHYKLNLPILVALAVLAVVTNWYFIPVFGIEGAALATLISFFLINVLRSLVIWRIFKIQPFTAKSALTALLIIVSFLLFSWLDLGQGIVAILLRSCLFSLFYGVLVYFLKLSEDVNTMVDRYCEKIKALVDGSGNRF